MNGLICFYCILKYTKTMEIKLSKREIKVLNSEDLFRVMREILLRDNKIDQEKEHFWVVSLDNLFYIQAVELVSLGSKYYTTIDPSEIFIITIKKQAQQVIFVHNHCNSVLQPSDEDIDFTNRLFHAGLIINVIVLDHLIINTMGFYSFSEFSQMDKIIHSKKYQNYIVDSKKAQLLSERLVNSGKQMTSYKIARSMAEAGETREKISLYTGLTIEEIERMDFSEM